MKVFKLLYILILVSLQYVNAQNNLPSLNYIPQAPTAAAYTRYGEIPVDYSTGVPKIEIPIYEIKSGNISVPLSISYHASGIKVTDVSSEVGLGWVLNAGGIITHTTLGVSDGTLKHNNLSGAWNIYNTPISEADLLVTADKYYQYATNPQLGGDFYTDRYYYCLPGGVSGIFRRNITNDSIFLIPYRPIKIEENLNPNVNWHFKITTSDGTQYFFVQKSYDLTSVFYFPEKIKSSNNDSILFYYKSPNDQLISRLCFTLNWSMNYPILSGPLFDRLNTTTYDNFHPSWNSITEPSVNIDSICSKNETIRFQYFNDRKDRNGGSRLQSIEIKNRNSKETIKSYNFYNQSYFGSTNLSWRLRLDSLSVSGSAKNKVEKYAFKYNSLELPPYPDLEIAIGKWKFYEDYWGYYNGIEKTTLIPSFLRANQNSFFNNNSYYADLHPSEYFAKACILTAISYPTGGKSVFEYESNKAERNPYLYTSHTESPVLSVGGLRIKSITSYTDYYSPCLIRSYEYAQAVNKTIAADNYFYTQDACAVSITNLVWDKMDYTKNLTTSTSVKPITMYNGASVLYGKVTEYIGTATSNSGKTEFYYYINDFEDVVEPELGKNDYRFYNPYQWDRGNYTPLLYKKLIYKNNNGVYDTVREEYSKYTDYKQNVFLTGLNLASTVDLECWGSATMYSALADYGYRNYLFSFVYSDTKGYTNTKLLVENVVKDYHQNGQITTSTSKFDYDDYTQMKRKEIQSSKKEYQKSIINYPYDFSSSGNIYEEMVSKNIITPVIKQTDSVSNRLIRSIITSYKNWGNNIIAPETVATTKGSASQDTRIRYYAYDNNGNVLDLSKENDTRSSYFWAYNQSYPVVKAENITSSDLIQKVNSAAGSSGLNTKNWITDPIAEKLNWKKFNSLLRSNCGPGVMVTTYTYKPVLGMTSATDPNGVTTYYEYDNSSRLSIIRDDDANILKQITYHLKQPEEKIPGAFYSIEKSGNFTRNNCETGYTGQAVTYIVPVGKYYSMVSQDAANQLAQEEFISNGQAYANQNGTCIPAYTNVLQSGTFTRNNCNTGLTGSTITYTVPAYQYRATTQTEADQLAVNDVNANGQNFANQWASCINVNVPSLKIFLENIHYDFNDQGNQYCDVIVRFYQDFNCTIPVSVSNLIVNIDLKQYNSETNITTHTTESKNTSGTSYIVFPNIMFSGLVNGEYIDKMFQLLPGIYNIVN